MNMDQMFEVVPMLLSGLGTDLLIVALSAVLPLLVGGGLTVLLHFTRKTALPKVFRYVAILSESLVPVVLVCAAYFSIFASFRQAIILVVFTLALSFLGYMVFRYDERDSLPKNLVVNGIGLIADLFKWCLAISGMVAVRDLLTNVRLVVSQTYDMSYYWIPLVVSFVILLILYIIRQLCKDLIK